MTAGRRPDPDQLIDVDRLVGAYYDEHPDPSNPGQAVSFGTSGHRGSSLAGTFNEDHIVAVSEAIARYRTSQGIDGPLFLGRDTHALSDPAFRTAVEVLVAHDIDVAIDADGGYTPTPVISHAILTHNAHGGAKADGIVITPSHNPPEDGGFKYNPPTRRAGRRRRDAADPGHGQPAVACAQLRGAQAAELRPGDQARPPAGRLLRPTSMTCANVVDMDAIRGRRAQARRGSARRRGRRATGQPIERPTVSTSRSSTRAVDPTFSFMTVDHDGKIRMDCSQPLRDGRPGPAQGPLRHRVRQRPRLRSARHRHAVGAGLMNPNHYLAVGDRVPAGHRAASGAATPASARRWCRAA